MADETFMAAEIRETPAVVARLMEREGEALGLLGRKLRELDPAVIVTCARGSSDHAAAYFKYLCEIITGVPTASIGPSVASLYKAPLKLGRAVVISVSQSGQSPDIVALQAAARAAGAYSIAIVNQADSPLAEAADAVVPLHAGPEQSVAATKTCLASAVALAAIVASWSSTMDLGLAVTKLPGTLEHALAADWSAALPLLEAAQSAYVVGRGPALPIAAEAALKLKETAVLHAEAFSGAEVMHGPLQLLQGGFPVLAFAQADASLAAMRDAVARLGRAGGRVLTVSADGAGDGELAVPASGHALLDPLVMLLRFYALAEQVARARGHDPDRPANLRKVTETI